MREKEQIEVLFVIFELASWKTEGLYNAMMVHPRFSPKLLVVPSLENRDAMRDVTDYLVRKGYVFDTIASGERIADRFRPDIIFYQKPYSWCIDKPLFFRKNLGSLFCYMSYCFRNTTKAFNQNSFFHNYAWQVYVENESVQEEMKAIMDNSGRNTIVTGLTIMDDLMKGKACFSDPWKRAGNLKRIIYAPHHTVNNEQVHRSTFLTYGDFMLRMAEKYKDRVQWAFKPHPLLKPKLDKLWGKEQADAYYEKWRSLENAQFEDGEYLGLFKHSEAMIHDCGSFILEYLYTGKPVMYLSGNDAPLEEDSNRQTREALKVHYIGRSLSDIESFINQVVDGEDALADARLAFYTTHLLPPGGHSACENVIRAILGESF